MLFVTFLSLLYIISGSEGILYRIPDGRFANLLCGINRRLRINSAYYCLDNDNSNCCEPDFTFQLISKLCNYHSSCFFFVSGYLFVGSCPLGRKHLTIDYSCDVTSNPNPRKCGRNEKWVNCRSACPKTCDNPYGLSPKNCTEPCIPGCECEDSYVRDQRSGYCMNPKYCYNYNEPREVFSKCNANSQEYCPPTTCQPGYVCMYPLVRNEAGHCVNRNECPTD